MTKLLRKLTIGSSNGVRGGLKGVKGRVRVLSIIGIAHSFKEHTSETMGTSYGFAGEFRGINVDGEESISPVCFMPEPAQGLLYAALADEHRIGGIQFAFDFFAVEDETALKGYYFECETKLDPKPSNALAELAHLSGYEKAPELALGHDKPEAEDVPETKAAEPVQAKPQSHGKKK
jgi:hypothetical protein